MPLPDNNPEWPPKDVAKALSRYEEWGAWYSGSAQALSKTYGGYFSQATLLDPKFDGRPGGMLGGIVGSVARRFWGAPPPGGALTTARLHIPLAGDIAATSADLLFGDEVKFHATVNAPEPADTGDGATATAAATSTDKKAQARIDLILDEGAVLATLLEAAEIASAYGGVFLRAGWDPDVADHVLIDAVPPDAAVPEWRSGRLRAVTFWREVKRDGAIVWRHLERHEVLGGEGVIWHGLYQGTDDRLGRVVPLPDAAETEPFAALVNELGYVKTGAKRLAVVYVPNMRPNRHPDLRGSLLGRSDFAGIEPVLDNLDEAWTSWMRDVRLGKGRLIVPDTYLTSRGRGKGAYFDAEREIFETVAALTTTDGGLQMQVVQFAIRVAEHRDTCEALTAEAVRGAGYSASTFGMAGNVAMTATENTNRKERSTTTRSRKIRYWTPELRRLLHAALEIDAAQFKSRITPLAPTVEFADAAGTDPGQQASTLQMLRAAEVMSMRTAVSELHPDWEPKQVDEEVQRIQDEASAAAAGPINIGGPGDGQPHLGSDGVPIDAAPDGASSAATDGPTAPGGGAGTPGGSRAVGGPVAAGAWGR